LEYLSRVLTRRSVVFLVSDFIGSGYEKALRVANKKHDVVAMTITDPRELSLPDVGFIQLEDAETGEVVLVDTSSVGVRYEFRQRAIRDSEERARMFRAINVDYVDIRTDQSYVEPLIRFFRMRAKRFR
ncbi:MAG: DUF58 domain-containing protein, partial [candidate division KSB1 bacterium]|nr:DUF58 domain-containing protein [candidate division KSB1 bacterium]